MDRLTEKQQLFVIEYLKDHNATRAALRSGYSKKSAYSQGQRLLKNVVIQECLIKHKDDLIQGLKQQFIKDAQIAQKVMYDILNNPNASNKDRITVAKDFLDRAGFVPTTRQEITGKDGGEIKIMFTDPSSDDGK